MGNFNGQKPKKKNFILNPWYAPIYYIYKLNQHNIHLYRYPRVRKNVHTRMQIKTLKY